MVHDTASALHLLTEGNRRFIEGTSINRFCSAAKRASVASGQKPWAVVVGCSDSRVPVEAIFDVGVGELFVIRSAGNVIGSVGFASLRFAVEVLGAQTVVVLGHEECGAVQAALSDSAPEWLAPVTSKVRLHAEDSRVHAGEDPPTGARLTKAVEAHIRESAKELEQRLRSEDVSVTPGIVGAVYALGSGQVHWLD